MGKSKRQQQLQEAIARWGLSSGQDIVDMALLDLALTHPSLSADSNNDRLEFLGDAILRLLVGEFLYRAYPHLGVGDLALLRSNLLSNAYFAQLGHEFDLDKDINVGASARNDRKGRNKRLADAFEAVVGALYLSWQHHHPERWQHLFREWLEPRFRLQATEVLGNLKLHNAKTALQELTQGRWGQLPRYLVDAVRAPVVAPSPSNSAVVTTGNPSLEPPTSPLSCPETPLQTPKSAQAIPFRAQVWVLDRCWGEGRGRTKKSAESAAALAALTALEQAIASGSL